jgi:hypothetical protein
VSGSGISNDNQQPGQSNGAAGSGYNPAWDKLLTDLPRQMHPIVSPHLKQWDQNYNRMAQEYAPWKKTFADKGITAEELNTAHSLYQLINTNPQELYRRLGEALGVSTQQAQQMVNDPNAAQPGQNQQDYQNYPGYEEDPNQQQVDPRLQALQQQNEMLMQRFQQDEYQRNVSNIEQQIDQQIRGLINQYGNVNVPDLMVRVQAQMARNEQVDINRAFSEQQQYNQQIIAMSRNPSATAPRVMPTSGGIPPNTEQQSAPKTQEERVNRVAALIDAAKRGGQ